MWIKFSELDAKSRNALPNSKFAYIDAKGGRHLPIHDANHVTAAFGRLNQQQDADGDLLDPAAKTAALAKIRAAAKRFGVDAKQAAEAAPSYGPGGDLDWDDHEEPDEDEDDTRPGDKKADEGAAPTPGLGLGDVHVPGPVNQSGKKSPALKNLARAVRAHFGTGRTLASDSFEKMFRQAIGSAGGRARKAAEDDDGIEAICCNDSCGLCEAPGCGCCENCYISVDAGEDANPENMGTGSPQEGEIRQHTEGDAHFRAPDGTGARMFLSFKATEPIKAGEWIEYMPAPGKWKSPKYGDIKITGERNQDFVTKFNEAVYQNRIPIDAEHETKLSGAVGWIEQMRVNPDESIGAYVDWTPRGAKMLAEKAFRYFSPEWYDKWKDPATEKIVDNVAIGGALTTRPFFKQSSLEPLVASEHGFVPIKLKEKRDMATKEEQPKRTMKELEDELAAMRGAAAEGDATAKTFEEKEDEFLAQVKKFAEEKDAAVKAKEAATAEADEAKAESKKLTERLDAIELNDRRRQFAEEARDFPGETAKHVQLMEHMNDEDRAAYTEIQKATGEQLKGSALYTPIGSTQRGEAQGNVVAQTIKAAEAAVKESGGKLSMTEAVAKQWTDETYREYLAESGN